MKFPWNKDIKKFNRRGHKFITTDEYIEWFKKSYPINYTKMDFSNFEYINANTYSNVGTKYGLCRIKPKHLSQGNLPSIQSAINKNNYFKNLAIEKWGNKFNYDKSMYINMYTKIIIKCPIHGDFMITPANHLSSITGCGKCGNEMTNSKNKLNPTGWRFEVWKNRSKNSKNFESFKLYIILCKNEEEEFYKIGKTYRKLNKRFLKSRMPYEYELILLFEDTSESISFYEKKLQQLNKENLYLPNLNFDGKYECYKQINKETWNFIKNNIIQTTASMLK